MAGVLPEARIQGAPRDQWKTPFTVSDAETWPFAYDASLAEEIAPFRKLEPAGPLLAAWLVRTPAIRRNDIHSSRRAPWFMQSLPMK